MPRLSIIIVTYNSRADIERCLGSVTGAHAPAVPHEILVVDNASSDDTLSVVRSQFPGVRTMTSGGNGGFARGNNIGIRNTAGELILLLNPDTVVAAGAIDRLVATLDADPGAAIVGPRLVGADGHAELSFGRMISPVAELRQKLLVTGNDRQWPLIASMVERMTQRAQVVEWVSGACLLARRRDVEAAGLLDERFFMYTEDVDLCASVRALGRTVLFEPAAVVVHLRGRSRATVSRAADAAYRRSHVAFYEKHHPRWAPLLRAYLRITGKM